MKIRCAKDELYEAIQTVQRAVSGRSTLPILNNVLLEADDDTLCLVAYDLEFGIECTLAVKVEARGGATIPARILAEVVGSMPEAEITIEVDERQVVTITCGGSRYEIHGLPAEEFPRLPLLTEGARALVNRARFRQLIRSTSFATSVDETRPILTGVLTQLTADTIMLVATDTHRLAWAKGNLDEPVSAPASAIIPGRIYGELLRVLNAVSEEQCEICIGENQAQFRLGRVAVQSRLIEGEFPNWEKVVPKDHQTRVTVEAESFRQALRRAAIVAREDANKIILGIKDDGITITADSQEVGTGHEELAATLEGPPVSIGFNARYLLDSLNVMDAEEIWIDLRGPLESGLVCPMGDDGYRYILMPMQVG
ncbi:MAG TPA: DNA polymerase III subunit beta [Armatimonadota bacterium]|nr:DNA polymerase III subunit beta [Armatimonadota bacterium]